MTRDKSRARSGLSSNLGSFEAVSDVPDVYEARKKGLGAFAIKLKSGNICIFSPVRGLEKPAADSLRALGEASVLFAPNHYHNLGLRAYAAAFPSARLVAPTAAIARLETVTGLSFSSSDELAAMLPDAMALLEPDGLKTGETWLRIQGREGVAWIVVDAFCGPNETNSAPAEPQLLKTFPKFGLGDRGRYVRWVEHQIRQDRPISLLPCHGSSIHDKTLPEKLLGLVSSQL